jgi:hypothetical protein
VRSKRLIPPCSRSETPHAAVSLDIEEITLNVDLRKQRGCVNADPGG